MIYKKYLLVAVKGKKIDKKTGDVKVYTPKRKAYKIDSKKDTKIPKELQLRDFLGIYKYKEAIKFIKKLPYGE